LAPDHRLGRRLFCILNSSTVRYKWMIHWMLNCFVVVGPSQTQVVSLLSNGLQILMIGLVECILLGS
jgi:hypothetical protein